MGETHRLSRSLRSSSSDFWSALQLAILSATSQVYDFSACAWAVFKLKRKKVENRCGLDRIYVSISIQWLSFRSNVALGNNCANGPAQVGSKYSHQQSQAPRRDLASEWTATHVAVHVPSRDQRSRKWAPKELNSILSKRHKQRDKHQFQKMRNPSRSHQPN